MLNEDISIEVTQTASIAKYKMDNSTKEINLKYINNNMRFADTIISDVVIEEIDAEPAEFINCRFEKVTFKESNLCDCRFKNCKFYGVLFQDCKFAGARFEKNVFAACKFQNCDFNPDSEAMNAYKLYRGTNFNGNKMQKCSFVDCDLQGMHQQDSPSITC